MTEVKRKEQDTNLNQTVNPRLQLDALYPDLDPRSVLTRQTIEFGREPYRLSMPGQDGTRIPMRERVQYSVK